MTKLYIDEQTDTRVILVVDHGGKHWEIDVTIDPDDDDYGINVDIGRDSGSLHVLRFRLDGKALQRAAGRRHQCFMAHRRRKGHSSDLTDDQAREVLQQASDRHDAGIGITWDVLEIHADNLFPKESKAQEA